MKKLSNAEAELKKALLTKKLVVAYIKKAYRKIKEIQHVELVQQRNR